MFNTSRYLRTSCSAIARATFLTTPNGRVPPGLETGALGLNGRPTIGHLWPYVPWFGFPQLLSGLCLLARLGMTLGLGGVTAFLALIRLVDFQRALLEPRDWFPNERTGCKSTLG